MKEGGCCGHPGERGRSSWLERGGRAGQSECCSPVQDLVVGLVRGRPWKTQFKELQVSRLLVLSVKKPSLSPVLLDLEDNEVEGACVSNIPFDTETKKGSPFMKEAKQKVKVLVNTSSQNILKKEATFVLVQMPGIKPRIGPILPCDVSQVTDLSEPQLQKGAFLSLEK